MKQITITENARGYDYPSATLASHIFSLTSGTYTNTAEGTSITVPAPSIKVKYNTSANGRNGIDDAISITPSVSDRIYVGSTYYTATRARLNANTDKALTSNGDASYTFPLSEYFTASNPTVKSIPINWVINSGWITTGVVNSQGLITVGYRENFTGTITSEGAIVLNAPPTFTASTVSEGPYYQNATQYTVNISSLSAKYGGTISEVKLTIGSQSVTRTDNGTLTITPQVAGTFTPTVTVTDSRGQVTTETLNSINVLANTINLSNVSAQRINASEKLDDEGTNAIVMLDANYTAFSGNYLLKPAVTINGTATSNVTWYETWDNTNGFSDAVNWTNYAPSSPKTLYGKATDTFTDSLSYQIGVSASTTYAQSSTITTTLAQAFYLLVGRAGGKGLGIGMKPTTEALHIGMEQHNYDDVTVDGDVTVGGGISVGGDATVDGKITTGGDVEPGGHIYMNNARYLQMKDSTGTYRNAVTYNSSNQFTFGNGSYTSSSGGSYFDGNSVNLRWKSNLTFNDNTMQNMFTVTSGSVTLASTASGANKSGTITLNNTGWTPLGVVGYASAGGTNPSNANIYRCYLTTRTSGKAVVTIYASNCGTSAMAPTIYAYVLWVRNT